jgi:hypothetical protein
MGTCGILLGRRQSRRRPRTLNVYGVRPFFLTGKNHETYLDDNRKTNLAKWKTMIRQPLRAV